MFRLLLLLALLVSGCGTVLGYMPTELELEAIRRGEDPRAEEETPVKEPEAEPPQPELTGETGPEFGIVLRWIDAATVIIDADDRRERVRLFKVTVPDDPTRAEKALDKAMNRYTYGANIRLSYPKRTKKGETIYRNAEGDLIATIE